MIWLFFVPLTPVLGVQKKDDLEQLFSDLEVLAERARLAGYPKLRSGLLAVGVLTLVGLEDEAIRALTPLVAKADARAREHLGPLFGEDDEEPS